MQDPKPVCMHLTPDTLTLLAYITTTSDQFKHVSQLNMKGMRWTNNIQSAVYAAERVSVGVLVERLNDSIDSA